MPATITSNPREPAFDDPAPQSPDSLPVEPDDGARPTPVPVDPGREREGERELALESQC